MAAVFQKLPDGINLGVANRLMSLGTITGPSSYTQVSTGSTPSGGQVVTAQQLGLKVLDGIILIALDPTGTYGVEAIIASPGRSNSAILLWYVAHTGAEVSGTTALNTTSVAILAIGR